LRDIERGARTVGPTTKQYADFSPGQQIFLVASRLLSEALTIAVRVIMRHPDSSPIPDRDIDTPGDALR